MLIEGPFHLQIFFIPRICIYNAANVFTRTEKQGVLHKLHHFEKSKSDISETYPS